MPSSDPFLEPQADPLAPVDELTHWLIGLAGRFTVGLLAGAILARALRGRHLHWSWAAIAAAVIALTNPLGTRLSSAVGIAAATAALLNRRWHREDLDAGADLAELARSRRSPLAPVRSLASAAALGCRRWAGVDPWLRAGRLVVGRDAHGRTVSIPFGVRGTGAHALLVGATGSGKTVTQTWMAVRAIERGMGAVVIDPKGDRAMHRSVRDAAARCGRPFIEWTPRGPTAYNPYARGSDTEIADKALAGERFTEPHYLRQAQRYLGHVVRALRKSGEETSLGSIVRHLDPGELERLARTLPEHDAQPTHEYLDALTPRQRSDLAGVRDRLAIVAESDVGAWLDPTGAASAARFDLHAAVLARAVVYFDLDADSRPLLTQMLAAAIVQDLQTTVAALQGRATPTLVVIDEFSALAAEQVVRLFGRARSAGFSLVLSTQELADLRLSGRERTLEQVLGNLSVLIAHRQVVPSSSELIAGLAGVAGTWKTARHSDGRATRTRTREGLLRGDQLLNLPPGWAAVIVLSDSGDARITRICSPAGG